MSQKQTYYAKSCSTCEHYTFRAESLTDARHWVINHLDCSQSWVVGPISDSLAHITV